MITTNENICMLSKINYTIPFCQNDLLNYAYKNDPLINKLAQQLKNITNIARVCKDGACRGLSYIFAAYEMNGLGAESLHQLKLCLDPPIPSISAFKEVNQHAEAAYSSCISNLLAERCTDIFDIQLNQFQYNGYCRLYNNCDLINIAPKPEGITNIEYVIQCLEENNKNVHSKNKKTYFKPDINIEKGIAHDLYNKIKLGSDTPTPSIYKAKQSLYDKIKKNKDITPNEIKSFIKEIYAYCILLQGSEAALFNLNSGIVFNNRFSPLYYTNLETNRKNISFKQLEKIIINKEIEKQNNAIIYTSNNHAMAICGKYYPQKGKYLFSFFEPNYGLMQSSDTNEFIEFLKQVINPEITLPIDCTQKIKTDVTIGRIQELQKIRTQSKTLKLPTIKNQELQFEIKKQLTKDNTEILLDDSTKLIFDNFHQKNNKLTMKLQKESDTFTIHSTLCDVNSTIALVNNVINKFPLLTTRNIHINSLGKTSYIPK